MKAKTRQKRGGTPLEPALEKTERAALPVRDLQLERILVPTDFSECSKKALRYAVAFAGQCSAEILLLHVVEPMPAPAEMMVTEGVELSEQLHQQAAKRLSQWRKEIGSKASAQTAVRSGAPYREIVQAAGENHVDLIVLGTHGRTRLAHLLIGSTAERVVRHAGCPVLVVRERERDFLPVSESKPSRAEYPTKGEHHYGIRTKEKRSRKSRSVLRRQD